MRPIAFLFLLPLAVVAAEPLRIPWHLAPAACGDGKALITLTSGVRLEGRLLSVSPTTFEMDVDRSSDKRKVAKGFQRLDRSEFAELRIRAKRIRGRVIGTIAGVVVAGPAAMGVADGAGGGWALPVYAGIIAAGHLLGREFDRESRLVVIEPVAPGDPAR